MNGYDPQDQPSYHPDNGDERFNYSGDRSQFDLDRDWWWDSDKREYYDDYGNRFEMFEIYNQVTEPEVSERCARVSQWMASQPRSRPNDRAVLDHLARYARELVSA